MSKNKIIGISAGLGATSIWGGLYVVSKAVMEAMPPFTLLTLRMLLGILTLYLFMRLTNRWRPPPRPLFWPIFWTGFIGYGISISFQFMGTHLSTASNGALVTSSTPAFVMFFAALLLKERITTRRFLALLVSSLGVLAVIDPRQAQWNSHLMRGNLYLLIAALAWALHSTLVRKVTRQTDVLNVSLVAFLGGLPANIPLALYEIIQGEPLHFTRGVILGILFLGIASTAIAMYLWNTAFARLDASTASLTFFAQPLVGTLLSVFFLDEKITPLFVVGGALIGTGIVLASEGD